MNVCIAARRRTSGRVEFVITDAPSFRAACEMIDVRPGEKIGVAEIEAAEWQDFVASAAPPIQAMRLALEATR